MKKKEMNDSKRAGCDVNLGDGVAVFCGSHFIYSDKIYFADVFYY
jgi:hypothetical protein